MPRGKAKPKPKKLNSQAKEALEKLFHNGTDTTYLLNIIVSSIRQMHDGYEKDVVTPTGETITIIEKNLVAAATHSHKLVSLLQELEVSADTAGDLEKDTEVKFIQRPVILPIDTRLAREQREALEVNQAEDDDEEGAKIGKVI